MKRASFLIVVLLALCALAPVADALVAGTATITGTVTDASSQPVVGALVTVCSEAVPTDCLAGATTGGGGAYSLGGVPDDGSAVLQVTGPTGGGLLSFRDSFPVIAQQSVYNATLRRGAVAGYVLGPGNAPVAAAQVDLHACCGPDGATAVSGPDGYFVVGDSTFLPDGSYNLRADKLGLFPGPTVAVAVAAGSTTTQNVTLVAGGTVQGMVTGFGAPVVGAFVNLFGTEPGTVTGPIGPTDASGHYASPVLPPGHYLIVANGPVGSPLLAQQVPLTITSGGTGILDFALVPGGTINVTVTQGDGSLYPDASVLAARCQGGIDPSTCQIVNTPTGHGTLVRVPAGEYDIVGAHGPGFPVLTITPPVHITVTPGSTFDCTFLGDAGSCGQADDADGVTPATENAGPNGGDGNHDGVPDVNQANVTSLPSSGAGQPYVAIASPAGTSLADVTAIDIAPLGQPPGNPDLPVGALGFKLEGVTTPTVDVKVYLPAGTTPNTYFKYVNGGWMDFTDHASFAGNVVTLHLTDNDQFDGDPTTGVILDPGAPAISAPPFAGFVSPIKNPPTTNSAKAGSTVSVKFSLGGNEGMNIFAAGYPKSHPCGTTNATSIDSPGASSLSYNATTGLYQINWKTQKAWANTCRELVVKFANGSIGTATFNLK